MSLTGVLGAILFLALLHNPVQALSATPPPGSYSAALTWDNSSDPNVTGYRVHYGAASGDYTNSVVVGNVTANTVPGLAGGVTYFFAITAFDANGLESEFSNEVIYVPGIPRVRIGVTATGQAALTVKGLIAHTYNVEATEDFTAWTVIGTVTLGNSGLLNFTDPNAASYPNRFYRTRDTQP